MGALTELQCLFNLFRESSLQLFTLRVEFENKQRSSSKIDPTCIICLSLP